MRTGVNEQKNTTNRRRERLAGGDTSIITNHPANEDPAELAYPEGRLGGRSHVPRAQSRAEALSRIATELIHIYGLADVLVKISAHRFDRLPPSSGTGL
jgi:hypothetical protein